MKLGRKVEEKQLTRQEQNKRNSIRRVGISALVAFLVFVGITVIQSNILNQEDTKQVYQVAKDIKVGTKITEKNIDAFFKLKEVPVSIIPEKFTTKSEDLVGKFVNREYKVNDIVTTDGVTDTERLYKDSIKNPIEIAFSVESLSAGVSGVIREGDYINIYGLRKKEDLTSTTFGEETLFEVDKAFTFKHVYVTKSLNSSGTEVKTGEESDESEDANNAVSTTLFNVIISEKDAEVFNEMLKNCDIKVSKLLYDTDKDYTEFLTETNEKAGEFSSKKESTKESTKEKETEPTPVIAQPVDNNLGENAPADATGITQQELDALQNPQTTATPLEGAQTEGEQAPSELEASEAGTPEATQGAVAGETN